MPSRIHWVRMTQTTWTRSKKKRKPRGSVTVNWEKSSNVEFRHSSILLKTGKQHTHTHTKVQRKNRQRENLEKPNFVELEKKEKTKNAINKCSSFTFFSSMVWRCNFLRTIRISIRYDILSIQQQCCRMAFCAQPSTKRIYEEKGGKGRRCARAIELA